MRSIDPYWRIDGGCNQSCQISSSPNKRSSDIADTCESMARMRFESIFRIIDLKINNASMPRNGRRLRTVRAGRVEPNQWPIAVTGVP